LTEIRLGTVNNKKVTIPSYEVKPGDVVKIREGSQKKKIFDNMVEKLTIVENVEPKIDYKHGAFIVPVDPASVDKFLTIPPLPPRKREVKRETGLKKYGEDFNRADFDSSLERTVSVNTSGLIEVK